MIMPPTLTPGPPPTGPGDKYHAHHPHHHHAHHNHPSTDHSPLTPPPNGAPLTTATPTPNITNTTSQQSQITQNQSHDSSSASSIIGQGNIAITGSNMTGNTPNSAIDCAGCGSPILDRFYLSAVERQWHAHCLKCAQCKVDLQAERSCFARDGLIFCKADYYR